MDPSRISLRPFKLSDVDDFLKWASDDIITRYLRWDSIPHDHSIGYVSIFPEAGEDRCRAHVGYALATDYWGQGIVTAALKMAVSRVFQDLQDVVRLEALVEVENKGSQRVLVFLRNLIGFSKEGLLRKYGYCKGEIRDMFAYSFSSTDKVL
ncbi:hypothetical protein K2173_008769 [Erythroxylum novogranatense]|uniref:N-acetyltransferase domain-containing protein n=1 Tax=Erythroxylum novogranatense TaxID=1862640 RepID=A0AAV8S5M4_9ROSI|nr:hypothetical protein K2173_008769 [Erythroxylum novogranatense]